MWLIFKKLREYLPDSGFAGRGPGWSASECQLNYSPGASVLKGRLGNAILGMGQRLSFVNSLHALGIIGSRRTAADDCRSPALELRIHGTD